MAAGHRQIDHTADLALEIWADSEEELLAEGARAVVEVMTEAAVLQPNGERAIEIESIDREDRLVRWLSEIVYLAVPGGFLTTESEIQLGTGGLVARVEGREDASDCIVTELKAVTYHDLEIVIVDGQWRASVVIDV